MNKELEQGRQSYRKEALHAGLNDYTAAKFSVFMKAYAGNTVEDEKQNCFGGFVMSWALRFKAGIERKYMTEAGDLIADALDFPPVERRCKIQKLEGIRTQPCEEPREPKKYGVSWKTQDGSISELCVDEHRNSYLKITHPEGHTEWLQLL